MPQLISLLGVGEEFGYFVRMSRFDPPSCHCSEMLTCRVVILFSQTDV